MRLIINLWCDSDNLRVDSSQLINIIGMVSFYYSGCQMEIIMLEYVILGDVGHYKYPLCTKHYRVFDESNPQIR